MPLNAFAHALNRSSVGISRDRSPLNTRPPWKRLSAGQGSAGLSPAKARSVSISARTNSYAWIRERLRELG